MKLRIFLFMCLIFSLSCTNSQTKELRVMSYNIRNGLGMDETRDLERQAKVIRAANPDVVALQEVDSMTVRSGHQDILAELAKLVSMHGTFSWAIDFDGGKYGVGILSREQPLSVARIALPGREEERTALAVEFVEYVFICTHLSLTEADALSSVGMIDDLASHYDKPVLLGGDFNSEPDSPAIAAFEKNWEIVSDVKPTYPADKPDIAIDYIMWHKNERFAVNEDEKLVIDEPNASDHRPIFVKLTYSTVSQ